MLHDEVVRFVWLKIEPLIEEQGYELVEAEFARGDRGWTLRLFVDKDGGFALDDCRKVSQLVSPVLDATGVVDDKYVLEVSSPGLDRPVRKPADFERFAGEAIKIKAHTPVAGRRRFAGVLQGSRDGLVTVDCDGTAYEVHLENIKKANLDR